MMLPAHAAARDIPVGLGAYPGDAYYDPNRPGWLPYWIDTPTESQAKYAWLASGGSVTAQQVVRPETVYTTPPMPPTVHAPTGAALTTPPGSAEEAQATIDAILARQMREWQATNQANMEDVNQKVNPPSSGTMWLIVGIVGVAGIALLLKR